MYAEEVLSREPCFTVPTLVQTPDTIGMVVRGYNMGGIRDGWLVFGQRPTRPPHDGLVDELCLVKSADDGRYYVRFLRRGRLPDRWDLLSVTGPAMLEVNLEWATLVDWVKPHRLNKHEVASLNGYHGDVADAN